MTVFATAAHPTLFQMIFLESQRATASKSLLFFHYGLERNTYKKPKAQTLFSFFFSPLSLPFSLPSLSPSSLSVSLSPLCAIDSTHTLHSYGCSIYCTCLDNSNLPHYASAIRFVSQIALKESQWANDIVPMWNYPRSPRNLESAN